MNEAQSVKSKPSSKASQFTVISRIFSSKNSLSTLGTTNSRTSIPSEVLEALEQKLIIDEYGYTDIKCNNCKLYLTFEEILALCVPLNSEGKPIIDVNSLDFQQLGLICLKCYADLVRRRSRLGSQKGENNSRAISAPNKSTPKSAYEPKKEETTSRNTSPLPQLKARPPGIRRASNKPNYKKYPFNYAKTSYKNSAYFSEGRRNPVKFYENLKKTN